MSSQTVLEQLNQAALEITNVLSDASIADRKSAVEEIFEKVVQQVPQEQFGFLEIVDSFKECESPSQEEEAINRFLALEETERLMVVKVMEIVYKIGLASDESDTDKRQYWFEKVRDANI